MPLTDIVQLEFESENELRKEVAKCRSVKLDDGIACDQKLGQLTDEEKYLLSQFVSKRRRSVNL